MRRFLPVLLVAALAVFSGQIALAEPKVSGSLVLDYTYDFSDNNAKLFEDLVRARVNVSGDVGDSLSYYVRLQAAFDAADAASAPDTTVEYSLPLAYATLKNVGTKGLNIGVGRQAVYWSITNAYAKAYARGSGVPGFTASYTLDPVTINTFYTLDAKPEFGARASYKTQVGGANVSLGGYTFGIKDSKTAGFGATGSVGVDSFGSVYFEAGSGRRGTGVVTDEQYVVVGANVDVLKQATGISGWIEYDAKGQNLAFSVSRELVPGLTLYFNGEKPKDKDLSTSITAEVSISF